MIFTVITIACIALLVISGVQTTRVGFMSRALRAEISNTAQKRNDVIARGGSWEEVTMIPYPDIDQSYKNLKWYKPWERPSTLVVFEKE